jgi:hypothetical protein
METFSFLNNAYELRYDLNLFQNRSKTISESDRNFLQNLDACLKKVMPATIDYLGLPAFSLNAKNPKIGDSRVIVGITEFGGQNGSGTAGFISRKDLFETNGNLPLNDSNKGEYMAVSKRSDYRNACTTVPHEFEHIINAISKMRMSLPEASRYDLAAFNASGIRGEDLGPDESFAHLFEEFSGEFSAVSLLVHDFLTHINGTPLAIEATLLDDALNKRSRGANVLLQYSNIRLADGTLDPTNSKTRDYVVSRIKSPKTGYQNLADYFHMTEEEMLKNFFVHLVRVARGIEPASEFIPPLFERNGKTSGINIVSFATDPRDFIGNPPHLHPLQIPLPLIGMASTVSVPAQSVTLRRYIVPASSRNGGAIDIATDGTGFTAWIVPL